MGGGGGGLLGQLWSEAGELEQQGWGQEPLPGVVVLGWLGATEHPSLIMTSQVSSVHLSTWAPLGFLTIWQPRGGGTGHRAVEAVRTDIP